MTVRGGLDDALEKLARRNELRQRAAAPPASPSPPAVTELVEAVASVVARHPHLQVALGVEGAGAPAALRVWAHDGVPHVSIEAVAMAPYDALDAVVVEPEPARPAAAGPPPHQPSPAGFAPDPVSAGWGPTSGLEGAGTAGNADGSGPASGDAGVGPAQEVTVPLRRPAEPLVIPSSEQAAKRLAALLRANPSLLHGTHPD